MAQGSKTGHAGPIYYLRGPAGPTEKSMANLKVKARISASKQLVLTKDRLTPCRLPRRGLLLVRTNLVPDYASAAEDVSSSLRRVTLPSGPTSSTSSMSIKSASFEWYKCADVDPGPATLPLRRFLRTRGYASYAFNNGRQESKCTVRRWKSTGTSLERECIRATGGKGSPSRRIDTCALATN